MSKNKKTPPEYILDGKDSSYAEENIPKETSGEFEILKSFYSNRENEKVYFSLFEGGVASKIEGGTSIFNPFNVFRYSKFGDSDSFDPSKNRDYILSGNINQNSQNSTTIDNETLHLQSNQYIENPSATNIIKWSRQLDNGSSVPIAPYSISDFIWCSDYGKIPNNRLITLRRYNIPVEDNLRILSSNMPLVPIAQAVSWFGGNTGNSLKSILSFTWGFNYKTFVSSVVDIDGNEITLDEILNDVNIDDNIKKLIKSAYAIDPQDTLSVNPDMEKKVQSYIKHAYDYNGPYWNKVLGPVNVIDRVQARQRGFREMNDIDIIFKYSLRSYNLINPKIAFLDLLSNFLSLTYNTAQFWGGGYRYFKKAGLVISSSFASQIYEGKILEGMQDAAESMMATFKDFGKNFINDLYQKLTSNDPNASNLLSGETGEMLSNILLQKLGPSFFNLISVKSPLNGEAIGEWHLTIGNPMNPIAVIGNLILKSCTMEFGEELGIDDFPTEVKFKVTLGHARPRAKQDIERIFNYGNGALSYNYLAPPPSARNSQGGQDDNGQSAVGLNLMANKSTISNIERADLDKTNYNTVKNRIRDMYGMKYSNSNILNLYFSKL